jgi:hypothetical protein
LHDTASTNGTFLNGQRVSGPERLASGDCVQVGGRPLFFVSEKDDLAGPEKVAPPRPLTPAEYARLAALAERTRRELDETAGLLLLAVARGDGSGEAEAARMADLWVNNHRNACLEMTQAAYTGAGDGPGRAERAALVLTSLLRTAFEADLCFQTPACGLAQGLACERIDWLARRLIIDWLARGRGHIADELWQPGGPD